MKLWQKIFSDVKASEKKGFMFTKSFGSVRAFTELKGMQNASFQEVLDALNEYLKPHKLVAFYSHKAKGVLFCNIKHYKQGKTKKTKNKDDGLEL